MNDWLNHDCELLPQVPEAERLKLERIQEALDGPLATTLEEWDRS